MSAVSPAQVRRAFGRVWLLVAALAVFATECTPNGYAGTKTGW